MANARVYGLASLARVRSAFSDAPVFEPLQREGHRPPAHARLSRRIEHGGGEPIVRLQAHEREHAEPKCSRRRVATPVRVLAGRLGERTRLNHLRDHPADRLRRGRVANQPEPFGRASPGRAATDPRARGRADRARAGHRSIPARTRPSAALPDPDRPAAATAARRPSAEPDATHGQRRAAAHARLLIGEHRRQIRRDGRWRRRRDGDRRLPARRNHRRKRRRRRRRGRRRIAEHALIFEAKNPGHLLLERRTGRLGRRRRRRRRRRRWGARARGGHERQRQHDRTTRHWSLTGCGRRSRARQTREPALVWSEAGSASPAGGRKRPSSRSSLADAKLRTSR